MKTEFKGTKGEWKQEHRIIDNGGMYATEVFSGDTVICSMKWCGEQIDEKTTTSRRPENAKLISSAPELLEVAQLTLNWIKTGQEMETDIKNKCENAIKKALGI